MKETLIFECYQEALATGTIEEIQEMTELVEDQGKYGLKRFKEGHLQGLLQGWGLGVITSVAALMIAAYTKK